MNNNAVNLKTYFSEGDELTLKFEGGSASVDLGDGTPIITYHDNVTHVYESGGDYDIVVVPLSNIDVLEFNAQELVTWGTDLIKRYIFTHDYPKFPNHLAAWVTDLSYMFYYEIESGGSLSKDALADWDVSNVTNMSHMFENRAGFVGVGYDTGVDVIENWDVSNVTDMSYMFSFCRALESDLSMWDVSNVTNMKGMFSNCYPKTSFNVWDTSSVTDMSYMFYASVNLADTDFSTWDTSSVMDMSHMFSDCYSFNGYLATWNTSNVTDMSYMFHKCYNLFEADALNRKMSLEKWDTGKVTNMSHMFYQCYNGVSFNMSRWNTSNVTDMSYMFSECYQMNHPTFWNTSKVTTMEGMFKGFYSFTSDLSGWDVSNVTNMDMMFYDCNWFVSSLENWDVSKIPTLPEGFLTDSSGNTDNNMQPPMNMPRWGQPASKP